MLQPADRGYFNVLKNEWKKACTQFATANPGLVVSKGTFSHVFVPAFDRAARPVVIKAAFKCSGIWPVNRNAIEDSAFAPARTFQSQSNVDSTPSTTQTSDTSVNGPCTSKPIKEDKNDRHPVVKSLVALQSTIEPTRLKLFEKRLEESYDVEDDAQYMAWKILKLRVNVIDKEIGTLSTVKSNLEADLRPIIENVLTFPQKLKVPKRKTQKVHLPRHLTSEAALKVLEAQDAEKRRKELVKEANRKKTEERNGRRRWRRETSV